jgi:hypothetical protein
LTGLIDLLNLKLPILQFSPLNYYFNNKKIFYELIYILSASECGLEKFFKSLLRKKIVVIVIN